MKYVQCIPEKLLFSVRICLFFNTVKKIWNHLSRKNVQTVLLMNIMVRNYKSTKSAIITITKVRKR